LWIEDAASDSSEGAASMNAPIGAAIIEAWNKIDLAREHPRGGKLAFSVKTGEGMDLLIATLTDAAREAAHVGENPAITRTRHRTGLESCRTALDHFLAGNFADLELRAEDLRQAATSLGRVTGRVDVEDILDRIFADFCIGK
jgi:tRNA modification GTPase